MVGRPPIDLNQQVRDLVQHTQPDPKLEEAPVENFERRINANFLLINYITKHIDSDSVYQSVYDRHMSLLHRMTLVSIIETFERFIKELAICCVDAIAGYTIDDRFDKFSASAGLLAVQFDSGTVGRALCEADTWLSNSSINERFRHLLKPHFAEQPWEFLFPNRRQQPAAERERADTLAVLWQVRHNITHNTGYLTGSDARRLTLMVRSRVTAGTIISPDAKGLRYTKQFLIKTAKHTNNRVGIRLAELLTELHADDPSLFEPQPKADTISTSFRQSLTVAGVTGVVQWTALGRLVSRTPFRYRERNVNGHATVFPQYHTLPPRCPLLNPHLLQRTPPVL